MWLQIEPAAIAPRAARGVRHGKQAITSRSGPLYDPIPAPYTPPYTSHRATGLSTPAPTARYLTPLRSFLSHTFLVHLSTCYMQLCLVYGRAQLLTLLPVPPPQLPRPARDAAPRISRLLQPSYSDPPPKRRASRYILPSSHRRTNYDKPLAVLCPRLPAAGRTPS